MVTAKNRAISVILIITLAIGMVGIVSTDTTYAAKKKIHLKKTTVRLVVGKKYQQKLIAKNGKVIKATKVKWKTKKKSVAKISKKGLITAVKPGTAKMTAKYKGKTYKFTVKVKKDPVVVSVKNKVGYASTYGDYLKRDVADWIYNEFYDPLSYKDYSTAIKKDQRKILKWLKEAKKIANDKKHTRLNSRLDGIIHNCNKLYIERIGGFGYTLDMARDYSDRVTKMVDSINKLYNEL